MDYEYKVVPFIGTNRGNLSAAEVARQLEVAINRHAAEGWEFHQLSDVNIEVQPGCIAGLFGAKVQYVRFDQLIFRAEGNVARRLTTESRGAESRSRRTDTPPATGSRRARDHSTGQAADRSSLAPDDEDINGGAVDSFCYHCGADVTVGAQECTTCGKTL